MDKTPIWRLLRRHRRGDPKAAREVLGMFLAPAPSPVIQEHVMRLLRRIYDGESPSLLTGTRRGRPPDETGRLGLACEVFEAISAGKSRAEAVESVRVAHRLADGRDIERAYDEFRQVILFRLAWAQVYPTDEATGEKPKGQ